MVEEFTCSNAFLDEFLVDHWDSQRLGLHFIEVVAAIGRIQDHIISLFGCDCAGSTAVLKFVG